MARGYRRYLTKARGELIRRKKHVEASPNKRPPSTRGEIIIAAFTGVLTAVGIIAAVATTLQWDASEKALHFAERSAIDSGRDTQAALAISDRVAKSTEDQVAIARRAAGISEKGLIVAKESLAASLSSDASLINEPITGFAVGQKYVANVTIVNTGRNPLRNVFVFGHAEFIAQGAVPPPGRVTFGEIPTIAYLAIGSRSGLRFTKNDPLTQQDIDLFAQNKVSLLIRGAARFEDANGTHYLSSCTVFSGESAYLGTGCGGEKPN